MVSGKMGQICQEKIHDWVPIRRRAGVSDAELSAILPASKERARGSGDDAEVRIDVVLEDWLFKWHRGRTEEEKAVFFQNYEKEVSYIAKSLSRFEPRSLIEVFAERLRTKLPFNKEMINTLCALCTIIVASRHVDDVRRQAREMHR